MAADVRTYARAAYAAGYAEAGPQAHPLPPPIEARFAAAIDAAEAHVDDDAVIEATLHIGRVDGLWAVIFNRRAALERRFRDRLTPIVRRLVRTVDIGQLVDDAANVFRSRTETLDPVGAGMAASGVVRQLRQAGTAERADLRQTVRDALASGLAEGRTDAEAILADLRNRVLIDFELTFNEYLAGLADLESLWAQADGWLGAVLDGMAGRLGKLLAAGAADGVSRVEQLRAVSDLLSVADDAAALILDHAIATALSDGALALYASEGVKQVEWLTAGDDRTCPACDAIEVGNPYDLADIPSPPEHFGCRCVVSALADSIELA